MDRPGYRPSRGETLDTTGLRQSLLQLQQRLVNMAAHRYKLEPNATFTPDGKWVVFRSNMHGASQVYAVEVAKAR
jgi:Tol biopolymer transport system component